jgi:DNA-binding CsgD family transcriptional regulator
MMAKRVDYVELARLRGLGLLHADIASQLGCSVSSVERATAKLDLERRQHGPRRNIDVPVLHRLWASEIETPEIAVRLGCSVSTLYLLRDRHKLPPRPRTRVTLLVDPTPQEIAERARECRERHYAQRRGESEHASKFRVWRGDQA